MKKFLLLGAMLLGLGGFISDVSAAVKFGDKYTSVAALEGNLFSIIDETAEKAVWQSGSGWGHEEGFDDYVTAMGNDQYTFKLISLAENENTDVQDYYVLRAVRANGNEYTFWGATPPYLNCASYGVAFFMGLGDNNQLGNDGALLAVWDVQYEADKGFSLKNIGVGKYFNGEGAYSETPVYFTFRTMEYEPDPVVLTPTDNTDAWYTGGQVVVKVNDFTDPTDKDSKRIVADPRWVVDPTNAQNNCIVVCSDDNASEEWDAQLFVALPNDVLLPEGSEINVSMLVRAEQPQSCGGQAHQNPGNYNYWDGVPGINFTKEWSVYKQTITVSDFMAKGESGGQPANKEGMGSLAFNLAKKGGKSNIFFIDDIVVTYTKPDVEPEPDPVWVEVIKNGDLEGDDISSFYMSEACFGFDDIKDANGNPDPKRPKFNADIKDGVGVDGSRGIEVQTFDNPVNAWDSQFFIRLPYVLPAGAKLIVEFDYKATQNATAGTQAHGEPGAYQHYQFAGNADFTTNWQHFSSTVTVDNSMATGSGGSGVISIAFNLTEVTTATKMYFDNISVKLDENKLDQYSASDVLPVKTFSVAYALFKQIAAAETLLAENEELTDQNKEDLAAAIKAAKEALEVNYEKGESYLTLGQGFEKTDADMEAARKALEDLIFGFSAAKITMSVHGDRTYSSESALDFSNVEGLTAYIIVSVDDENVTRLKQVYKVPAETGLYLKGEAGEYVVPILTGEADDVEGNLLVATTSDGRVPSSSSKNGYDNYILFGAKGDPGEPRGFYHVKKGGDINEEPYNKAYLHIETGDSEAPLRILLEDEGNATRIANINTQKAADGAWYTTIGVKLNGVPTLKGMYIHNGKKVMIK